MDVSFRMRFQAVSYTHLPHTDYVKQTCIEPTDTWEVYRMRPEFDTQRKVEAYFAGKTDDDSIWIRDGLYALISLSLIHISCSCIS